MKKKEEPKLLSPKLDIVFKLLFSKNTELLINLLNSCLDRKKEQEIKTVEVKNKEIEPDEVKGKFIVLDLFLTDESGNKYNVEMQVAKFPYYNNRSMFYLCKAFIEGLNSGEPYINLKKTIGIHFLDHKVYPRRSEFHYCFQFRERNIPKLVWTQDLELHIFELPKLKKKKSNKKKETKANQENKDLLEWLRFFNRAPNETEETMKTEYNNPAVQKAFSALQSLSADESTRMLAWQREKALHDEATILISLAQAKEKTKQAEEKTKQAKEETKQAKEKAEKIEKQLQQVEEEAVKNIILMKIEEKTLQLSKYQELREQKILTSEQYDSLACPVLEELKELQKRVNTQ